MPVLTRENLAVKFRQNWMAKYPLDTCSNGGISLDDSLTSLNWLQNLNIMKITSPTPPPSPVPFGNYANNEINKNMKVNPNAILNVSCSPPQCKLESKFPLGDSPPTSLNGEAIDYKTNPYVKPPYSYATLICMAMKETKKSKITLSSIYNWITDNFMYYRLADPSWQNSIRHNLSLNKCFQKVPRRKDEPGKGGFWRINPEYTDMIDNGVFKKRRNSREGACPSTQPPLKKIKKEPEDDFLYGCHGKSMKHESVIHFNNEDHESLKGDFNWTSILHQDIEIAGIKIKTEDLLDGPDSSSNSVPSDPLSPPSSECDSDNFSIEDLFSQTDLSQDNAFDYTTNDPLDLTINGSHISPPEWWNEGLSADVKSESGLHTPIIPSSPIQVQDHLDQGHPWAESSTFADIAEAFDVDNLFDLENIPSPKLS